MLHVWGTIIFAMPVTFHPVRMPFFKNVVKWAGEGDVYVFLGQSLLIAYRKYSFQGGCKISLEGGALILDILVKLVL